MNVKIFRWKAIGPLLLLFALIAVLVYLFAEPVAKSTTEQVSTEVLGTQVDVGALDIDPRAISVDLSRLQVANPFDRMSNLVEAANIRVLLEPRALAEKKLVIRRLSLGGMRFGTQRATPARPVRGGGGASAILSSVRQWAQRFDVPLLSLTPIDTIRQLALNPTQLSTVREAKALAARTDSTRQALAQALGGLGVQATVDSARALADRLAGTDVKQLGLNGARDAVASAKRTLQQVQEAKGQVEGVRRNVENGVSALRRGLAEVDAARRRDYAFAKGLLQLPSFAAPDIGKAFFGGVSIDRFQQALYWAQVAREHMPAGLLPKEETGPRRLRASGATVRFPKEHQYPAFLLEAGQLDFALEGDNPLHGDYEASVRGLTSAPALYGKPTFFGARRTAAGSALASLRVGGVINHLTAQMRDSVSAVAAGVRLPAIRLPKAPFRLDPQRGSTSLTFALRGDQINGRWSIGSKQVAWSADTAGHKFNDVERVVWRVLSSLNDLNVTAELTGTIRSPNLSVASNLDNAVASRLKAVVGEEVAKAEAKARAEVDRLVNDQVAPLKRQVALVQTEAQERVAEQKQRLDDVEQRLNTELKRLVPGPVNDLIKLPKIKL